MTASSPPPPEEGPFTRRITDHPDASGFPYVTTALRASYTLTDPGKAWSVAAHGGIGRIWGKGITPLLAGATLRYAAGRFRFGIQGEGWWFDVPKVTRIQEFLDGELVASERIDCDVSESPVSFELRVGFFVSGSGEGG